MLNFKDTITSQFANSPTILALMANMDAYIRQDANYQQFYNYIWNVNTAQGFGLDIWGRIVDVSRYLKVPSTEINFGFSAAGNASATPFGQGVFYSGAAATNTYALSDDAYRVLILAKALANISATTSQALNQLLRNLFPGRGRCYVNDLGGMQMRYTFEFALLPYELAIVTSSGVLPHGAGVQVFVLQRPAPFFGFSEMGTADAAPFGQAVFNAQ